MRTRTCRRFLRSLTLLACGGCFAGTGHAQTLEGDLTFEPGIIYTDNVCLSKSDKKDDFTGVATLTPVGTLAVKTSRTTASLGGSIRINTLTNGDLRDDGCSGQPLDDRQQWYPSITGSLNTILIGNWLGFDSNLRADQNRVDAAKASSDDGLNRNGNNNTFYRYSLSPYLKRPVTASTDFSARYTFSQVVNTSDEVSNSDRHALSSGLSGEVGPRITWGLNGQYSITSYEDDFVNKNTGETTPRKDTELRNLALRLAYQIGRRWEVNGTYGWEWNDFETSGNFNQGGSAWDIGAKWTPNPRTIVSVGMGDRFFGQTPRVAFSHEGRRTKISGTYNKRITFQRDLTTLGLNDSSIGSFAGGDSINNVGLLPDTTFDDNGDPSIGLGTNSSISSNSAILDERGTLTMSYEGRPGRFTLFTSYSQQTRADDGAQADFLDWEISWRPNLSQKYSLMTAIGYEDIVPTGFRGGGVNFDSADKSENWYYRLIYIRSFNRKVGVNLEYRFTDRRSNVSSNEYQENLVSATLVIHL